MTIREFIIETYRRLRRQGGFGYEHHSCAYRTDDGRHCAIGIWLVDQLPDDHRIWLNGGSVTVACRELPDVKRALLGLVTLPVDSGIKTDAAATIPHLFRAVQQAHDDVATRSVDRRQASRSDWHALRRYLRIVADDYGVKL